MKTNCGRTRGRSGKWRRSGGELEENFGETGRGEKGELRGNWGRIEGYLQIKLSDSTSSMISWGSQVLVVAFCSLGTGPRAHGAVRSMVHFAVLVQNSLRKLGLFCRKKNSGPKFDSYFKNLAKA